MSVKVGDKVYLVAHAYYHVLGEVTEVLGVRRVALKDASYVYSCRRSWEEFFRDGVKTDTVTHYWGELPDVGYILAVKWNHELPRPKS